MEGARYLTARWPDCPLDLPDYENVVQMVSSEVELLKFGVEQCASCGATPLKVRPTPAICACRSSPYRSLSDCAVCRVTGSLQSATTNRNLPTRTSRVLIQRLPSSIPYC